MKKVVMFMSMLSLLLTISGCGANEDINSKIESLEQRVSKLEDNGAITAKATQTPNNTKKSTGENSSDLNVLSFELENSDPNATKSSVKHTYKVINNGDAPIEYVSIKIAYYDNNGNCINTDSRFKDVVIEPQKFVTIDSYGGEENTKANIVSSKVTSYYYYLVNPNANGNNKIEVNCETGKVKESFVER